jgi:hypothetical protein
MAQTSELRRAVLRRHAVRRRLRAPVRGHAGADAGLAGETCRVAGADSCVLRPRIHPEQPALRRRRRTRQRGGAARVEAVARDAPPDARRCRPASASNSTPIPSCAGTRPPCAPPPRPPRPRAGRCDRNLHRDPRVEEPLLTPGPDTMTTRRNIRIQALGRAGPPASPPHVTSGPICGFTAIS